MRYLLVALLAYALLGFWATNYTLVRPTGDEKVYIAQAIEMSKAGHWFLQSFKGDPYYFKGPLFYILLRVGCLVFGETSIFALLYMNVIMTLLGMIAMYQVLIKDDFLSQKDSACWSFLTFATIGSFSHLFASQMETLTIVWYSVLLLLIVQLIDRLKNGMPETGGKPDGFPSQMILVWSWIGAASWLKSPVYSVLLGCSACMVWLVYCTQKNLRSIIRLMAPIALGVLIALLLYAPIIWFDFEAFWNSYIVRENLQKGRNEIPAWQVFVPVTSWFLFPMMIPGFVLFTRSCRLILKTAIMNRLELPIQVSASLILAIPTLLFFCFHPYRSAIYSLPVLPCIFVLLAYGYRSLREQARPNHLMQALQQISIWLVPGVVAAFKWVPPSRIDWLPTWLPIFCLGGSALISLMQLRWSVGRLAISAMVYNFAILLPVLNQIGVEDFRYIRALAKEDTLPRAKGQELNNGLVDGSQQYFFWATGDTTFTEWGLLRHFTKIFWQPVFAKDAPSYRFLPGDTVLVPTAAQFEAELKPMLDRQKIHYQNELVPRWKVHFHTEAGGILAKSASLRQYLLTGDIGHLKRPMVAVKILR